MRFGILGFGHHAAKRLMPAFRMAETAKLAGLWRRDPAKGKADAEKFGIPHVFATAEELCSSPEIDGIFVVSPDALHCEHTLLALRHGKPVLCEKPLAMNVAEAEEMQAAAEKAGVLFGVAQNMRYNLAIDLMRRWIEEGKIGKPQLAHAQFCYQTDRSPRVWINDPALALGGVIGDVGIHCIDALNYVLGDEVKSLTALAHGDAESGAVESHAVLALDFRSGAMGTVTLTARASYRSYLEVVGEQGTLLCENAMTIEHPVSLIHRQGADVIVEQPVNQGDAFARMLDSFAAAANGGPTFRATGAEGVRNQRTLDAAYRSVKSGMREMLG